MDTSLLDALLGFALAYSATYVLYCWVNDVPRKSSVPIHARGGVMSEMPSHRSNSSSPV